METTWLFFGRGAVMPCGVFLSLEKACTWIAENKLSGTLVQFPLDEGVYDHAVRTSMFRPRKDSEASPWFKETFTPNLVQEFYQDGQSARLATNGQRYSLT